MVPRRSNLPCEWLSNKQCSTWEVKPAAWPFLSTFHCFDQFRTSYIYWYLIYFHISKYNLLLLYSLQPSLSDWVSLPLRIFSWWNGEVLFQALFPFSIYFWFSRIPKTIPSQNVTEPRVSKNALIQFFFIFGPIRRIWFLLFLPNVNSPIRSLRLVLTLSTSAQRGWSAGF